MILEIWRDSFAELTLFDLKKDVRADDGRVTRSKFESVVSVTLTTQFLGITH